MGRCIRDNEAEAVIPGTRIVLDGPGHREGATDREGTAVIEALPIGTYQLAVTLPGFVDVRVSIDVGPSSTASHQFRLRPGMLRTTDYLKPVRETVRTLLLHGPQVDPLGSGEFAHSWRSRILRTCSRHSRSCGDSKASTGHRIMHIPSTSKRLLLILCLAVTATPPTLVAICPQPGSTCEQVAKADLVFLADVLETTSVPRRNEQGGLMPQGIVNYRFNILDGVKGIEAGEFLAQFYFGGGQDLDSFRPGSRYLVFATRTETGVYRSRCGVSRETIKADGREWWPTPREDLELCLKKR